VLTDGALQAVTKSGERKGGLTGGSSLSGPPSPSVVRAARAPWPKPATPCVRVIPKFVNHMIREYFLYLYVCTISSYYHM
jgi:hypothetical protein